MCATRRSAGPIIASIILNLALALGGTLPASNASSVGGTGMGGTGTPALRDGLGGTGAVANDSGIGGTGMVADESGIGGTGIVGTITGFGSIFVNGVEIHYDPATPLQINGRDAAVSDLAIGQVVSVEALGTGPEVRARNIRILHAVSGPISGIDTAHGQIRVLGQTVRLTGATILTDGNEKPLVRAKLRPGDFIEVSGLRQNNGTIVASQIERTPARATVSVIGPVTRVGDGEFSVYGIHVEPTPAAPRNNVVTGSQVRVSGHLRGDRLQADTLRVEPAIPFAGRLGRLELEGYVQRRTTTQVKVGHVSIDLSANTRFTQGSADTLSTDQRVRVSAHIGPDHRLKADRIQFELERPEHERHGSVDEGHREGSDRTEQTDRTEVERSGIERPETERPELDRPEFERPELDRPELDRPEFERPEVERPE